jgi:hypothetical protein
MPPHTELAFAAILLFGLLGMTARVSLQKLLGKCATPLGRGSVVRETVELLGVSISHSARLGHHWWQGGRRDRRSLWTPVQATQDRCNRVRLQPGRENRRKKTTEALAEKPEGVYAGCPTKIAVETSPSH